MEGLEEQYGASQLRSVCRNKKYGGFHKKEFGIEFRINFDVLLMRNTFKKHFFVLLVTLTTTFYINYLCIHTVNTDWLTALNFLVFNLTFDPIRSAH